MNTQLAELAQRRTNSPNSVDFKLPARYYRKGKIRPRGASHFQLHQAQEKVMQGYVNKGYLENTERGFLHMFFSPYRVPRCMTKGEVRIVVFLQREHESEVAAAKHKIRSCGAVMTRSGFLKLIAGVRRAMD